MLPNVNETMTVNELTRINDQLRKNSNAMLNKAAHVESVGYQTAAVTAGGDNGPLSPIVPQSIESVLASATFTMSDLVLWQKLPKVQVTNTIHEYAVIKEHGQDLDPFIQEGGGGSTFAGTQSSYERRSVKIKYMAEKRQISDVSNLVGIIGANPNALAEETERGTMSLMRKVENQLFWGDEKATGRGFDGILKQIEHASASHGQNDFNADDFSDNTFDIGGALAGFELAEKMNDVLGELHSAPRFGKPDIIMVEPRVYAQMIRASIESGRNDQLLVTGAGSTATFGAGPQVHVMGPMGPVPVVSAPFLHRQFKAPSAGAGSANKPTFGARNAVVTALADAAGQLGGLDNAKFYKYKVIGVSSEGYSDPVIMDDAAGAGNGVQPTGDGLSFQVTFNGADYVRIYRSAGADAADAVDLDSCVLIAEVLASEVAAAGGFKDRGAERHSCGRALFMQMDQNVVEFARLLDFLRRPLAETSAAKQFLLMLFGSPVVKVPSKCFTLRGIPYTEVF